MSKLLIIAHNEASAGFKLAGVPVKIVPENEDISAILRNIAAEGEYGLIVVEQSLLDRVDEAVLKKIKKTGLPAIFPIDIPDSWQSGVETDSYIADLIRKAIGYQVKVKNRT